MVSEITNKKVLVTGGAGFIGSNICKAMVKQGNQVVCLDNLATGNIENIKDIIMSSSFNFIESDIRSIDDCKKAVSGINIVLHQAALGSVPRSVEDPLTTNAVNCNGFLNMLVASRDASVQRFIYATSSSVYGDSKVLPKKETLIGNQLSPYAVSKYVNELYACVFANLYSMEIIGLRYFNVFGPNQSPEGAYAAAIPGFIKLLLNGSSPKIHGNGSQSRDFTHVSNVVMANNLAATTTNKKALNKVFNIAYGKRTTVNELVETLKNILSKHDGKIANIPLQFVPPRKGDVEHSYASINRAKTILGYNPQIDLTKGLEQSIQWYIEKLTIKS